MHAEKPTFKYPLPFSLSPLPLCHYLGSALGRNCPFFAGSLQRAADNTVIYSWVMLMRADDSVIYREVITLKSLCCASMWLEGGVWTVGQSGLGVCKW